MATPPPSSLQGLEVESDRALSLVRRTAASKGDGLFATSPFGVGEIVLPGSLIRRAECNDAHAFQISRDQFGHEVGLGSFVNHSCDPNCGVRPTNGGTFDLVARMPIRMGDEITVDYAMRNYLIEFFPAVCECGAPCCRSQITGWKDLPADRRLEYAGSVASYLLEIEFEAF